MRHHPLYLVICLLFAIALEFIIVWRLRQHTGASSRDEADEDR